MNFNSMSDEERIALVEKIYVIYPRLKKLIAQMDYCRRHSKIAAEPIGMLITGPQGQGKTTLRKFYHQRFPRRLVSGRTIVPVLSVAVPIPATIKNLATYILVAFGDPAADKGSISSQTLRIYHYANVCETELFIFDEFQHFIDRDSLKVLRTISDWLKMLMNELGKPVILMGMPKSETVLDAPENVQLSRRFPIREHLPPFVWKTKNDRDEFRKFLKMLEVKLPFLENSNLSDMELAGCIYEATDGVIDSMMKLIRRASEHAIKRGGESLDRHLLAQAFEDYLSAKKSHKLNPFVDK